MGFCFAIDSCHVPPPRAPSAPDDETPLPSFCTGRIKLPAARLAQKARFLLRYENSF
jgi:hypothetical protein